MLDSQAAESEGDAVRECRASLALCMLLLLKQRLKSVYSLSPERIASFNPGQLLQPQSTFNIGHQLSSNQQRSVDLATLS